MPKAPIHCTSTSLACETWEGKSENSYQEPHPDPRKPIPDLQNLPPLRKTKWKGSYFPQARTAPTTNSKHL
ncbi:hypothetical protein M0R45_007049 [Rubus argutus]|uniref:Prolactin receptor n=1 Tax=Rubus argutus TaxID=59490 RepID=A0AAW1YTE5_RUBAR